MNKLWLHINALIVILKPLIDGLGKNLKKIGVGGPKTEINLKYLKTRPLQTFWRKIQKLKFFRKKSKNQPRISQN